MSNDTKRIVCLANSRKRSGRCIAGKEILLNRQPGGWIRPVSSRPSEEVSEYERQYEDGSDPRVLDVIEIPILNALPKNYQQENWLLDPELYWEKVGSLSPDNLDRWVDRVQTLWINEYSSYSGLNDRVPQGIANSLDGSLYLIKASSVELRVWQPGLDFGNPKRRVQGRFSYGGVEYWLWVTDPTYERKYLRLPNGSYTIGQSYLTVSLGDVDRGYAYKLIAAIIELDR